MIQCENLFYFQMLQLILDVYQVSDRSYSMKSLKSYYVIITLPLFSIAKEFQAQVGQVIAGLKWLIVLAAGTI